jgi:tRNA nucleotidyltransferase (CCA-adding enzyme)
VKVYQVGGSVRDALLGLPVQDRDWVVVGATPDELLSRGFRPVGRDFPVFLHPETHEEYALARTERKSGRGYHGFVFHTSPDVTLEDDLARRDLTINAMALDEGGDVIDPFGGRRDLDARVLRHVGAAFAEDPLRVLRVARFAARFGFHVADETLALVRSLVEAGELAELTPERVWQELARGFMEAMPSRMLSVLRACGGLAAVMPEVDARYAAPAFGEQPDAGVETAIALDRAAALRSPLPTRYAVLCRGLEPDAAERLAERLRAPKECRDAALVASKFASTLERARALGADDWLSLLTGIDAVRRPERLETLCEVVRASMRGDAPEPTPDAIAARARGALDAVRAVDLSAVAEDGTDIPARVRGARLAALESYLSRVATGA